jgi:hypothetical protein
MSLLNWPFRPPPTVGLSDDSLTNSDSRLLPPYLTALSTAETAIGSIWRSVAVSTVGQGHRSEDAHGHDYSCCLALGDSTTALLVADGAGTSHQAAWGARAAVELTVPLLRAAVPAIGIASSAHALGHVLSSIIEGSERQLLAERRRYELSTEDALTTLGIVVIRPPYVVYAGIGDGFLVVGLRDGRYFLPVPIARAGRYHNETWLLGHDDWRAYGFCYSLCDPDVVSVALSTDGLEEVLLDYRPHGLDEPGAEPLRPVPDRLSGAVGALQQGEADVHDIASHLAKLLLSPDVGALSEDDLSLALAVAGV